jgi:pimeloyl-ACP methyl ester carboxylesterase
VLEDVTSTWPIDENRIYGYGLSMGGGECLAFAARHQDPTSPTMLAAAVDQSGTISVTRMYAVNPMWPGVLKDIYEAPDYGTSPEGDFLYQRATVLDLPFSGAAPLDYVQEWDDHQAHNLRWVPRANFHASAPVDDQEEMIDPIDAFQLFLADPLIDAPDQLPLLPGADLHQWNALAPATVLAYFDARNRAQTVAQFSTQLPQVPGHHHEMLLFAEDGKRHHCFSVQRTNPNRFGRLHVRLYPTLPALNAVVLAVNQVPALVNVSHVTIHADEHLHHVDWSGAAGTTVHLYAPGVDLGTIDVVGPGSPTLVEYKVGGNLLDAAGQWTWSSGTLSLPEDGSTGLQRDWFVHY